MDRPRRRPARLVAALAAAALTLASCSAAGGGKSGASSGPKVKGGTVTVAYLPGTQPVDILPLFPAQDDTVQEIFWFVEQFWRPLYWFGKGSSLSLNEQLSIAKLPVFSNGGKTVSITLKNWKWSDGKPITTRDVELWMNLLKAEKSNYANYVPGYFPDNIQSIDYQSTHTFSITFKRAYNSSWLLLNQLCLLFALPQHAWDKTSASGPIGNYDTTTAGAKAVFNFLNSQAKNLSTYATNPLWQVVDGPFKISSYQANSEVTMVPNKAYSGPDHPSVSKVEFLNFTSDAAEYNQLLSGNIDYGYVPFNDVPSEGQLKSQGYSIVPWAQAGMNYATYNYTSPTTGPLFRQIYIRQAMQHLVDQTGMIHSALYNSGVPTYGPVPPYQPQPTANGRPLTDSTERQNLYPYSVSDAVSILRGHGWTIHRNGADTCTRPGTAPNDCGAGISAGQQLKFNFLYPTGVIQDQIEAEMLASDASKAGVQIQQKPVPPSVTFAAGPCTKGSACTWNTDYYYLGGWQYGVPINYPLGTVIFGCGGAYVGGYCSKTLDTYMANAEVGSSLKSLYQYEDYLTRNVPVLWLPLQPYQFSAISNHLHGTTPQNMGYWIFPENWYLTR